jgi:hypothetical protein
MPGPRPGIDVFAAPHGGWMVGTSREEFNAAR